MCKDSVKKYILLLLVPAVIIPITDNAAAAVKTGRQKSTAEQVLTSPNRPIRNRRKPTLTVGQRQGDLQGNSDKVIQAAIEYLNRTGGGTLHILPGVYELHNAVYLRPDITLQGSGEKTVLKKAAGVVTALAQDSDWFEYGICVNDTKGFVVGGGIMLRAKPDPDNWRYDVLRATVTAIEKNTIFIDRLTEKNFWMNKSATAATIFPLVTAENVDDVIIKNIVLDGNRNNNEHINGNYSAGVFIQHCNNWTFDNVTCRNYNGDGFSFQVCDDIRFENSRAIENTDLGFHPGSGSQRPVFKNCISKGNSQGIYFCWGVCDGFVQNCFLSENKKYGISLGYRDTDNAIKDCRIERNGNIGILFRAERSRFRSAGYNRIENCLIRDNGGDKEGIGIDIQGKIGNITVTGTKFENTAGTKQQTAIRISKNSEQIVLRDNTFKNCPVDIEDLRTHWRP